MLVKMSSLDLSLLDPTKPVDINQLKRIFEQIDKNINSVSTTPGTGGTTDHALLTHLTFISSGHTGFQSALGFTPEDVTNKSTDVLLGVSNILYPSQKAVKTYADTKVSSVSGTANRISVTAGTTPTVNLDTTLMPSPAVGDIGKALVATGANAATWQVVALSTTNKRLGCMDIDGVTNTVDTDYGLYTVPASTYAKNVKIYICNRNGGYTARVRLAHVDGAVGDVAVADYILFDDYLLPYETKIVELDGMVATDTILCRSSVSLVNFEACGEELTTDVYRKRVGALDIDGTTNAIDTDKVVYTSDRATKVNVLICNRNSGYVAECQIAHVNSDDIADIADEDRKFFTLDVNQSLFLELDLNMAINEIISFRSDTTNVNCLVYLAE
jgi:hypothetical protein